MSETPLNSPRFVHDLQLSKGHILTRMSETSSQKLTVITLVALLILLSALSMRMMRTSSLWYDEVWSLKCAGGAEYGPGSLAYTIDCVRLNESSPPGYDLLLSFWGRLVGWSEFSGWMLSLLVGLVAVASMYRVGHDLFRELGEPSARMIGLAAAIILGMSAFFIQFLFEMRVYVFMVLGTIWFVWLYWRLRSQNNPSKRIQVTFALSIAALLYLHYLMVLVFGAVAFYHLLAVKKDRFWWRVPLLMLAGSILFLPWVGALLNMTSVVVGIQGFRRSPDQMLELIAYTFSNSNVGFVALLGIFALSAGVLKQKATRFIWLIFVVSLLGGLLLVALLPFINRARYLLYLWPLAALVVALGIEQLRKRRVNPALILLVWVAAGLWNYSNPAPDNMEHNLRLPWRTFRTELQAHAQPGDVILFHTPIEVMFETLEFNHYTYGLSANRSLTENIAGKPDNDEYFTNAEKFIASAPRIWLGIEQYTQPNFRLGEVQRILAADYTYCYTPFNIPWQMRLDLYARKHSAPEFRFSGQSDQVEMSLLEPLTVDSEKSLSVLLAISHLASLPVDTYSIGLHLEDATGQLKAQADFGLPDDVDSCHFGTLSLKDLPPGKYTLRVAVYQWRNGERLTGQTLATGKIDERPVLGIIDVN